MTSRGSVCLWLWTVPPVYCGWEELLFSSRHPTSLHAAFSKAMCVRITVPTNVLIQNKHSGEQLQSSYRAVQSRLLWQLVQKGACCCWVFIVGQFCNASILLSGALSWELAMGTLSCATGSGR